MSLPAASVPSPDRPGPEAGHAGGPSAAGGAPRGGLLAGVTWSGLGTAALDLLRAFLVICTVVSFTVLWFFNPQAGRSLLVLLPIMALATFARIRAALLPWSIYVIGFLVFVDLRGISAEIIFPARYEYVIALERILFLGQIPTILLQNAFYRLGQPSAMDIALIAVHFSFFAVPHIVAAALWIARPDLFRRYVYALVATCWVGLIAAFLLPTAPPWLAGGEQKIPHVYRIMRDVMMRVTPETYEAGMRIVGENDAAAMPSLHTALTVLVALGAAAVGRMWGVVGWLYAAAMAFALVYLGEHYVIDILAGGGLAWFAWRVLGSDVTKAQRSLGYADNADGRAVVRGSRHA